MQFPTMDTYALSYEQRVFRPNTYIYCAICQSQLVVPGSLFEGKQEQIVMIGCSPKPDRNGPRMIGMLGFHLNRSVGPVRSLTEFAHQLIKERHS